MSGWSDQYGCTLCPVFTSNKHAGSTSIAACESCSQGFYQNERGQLACKSASCPQGTYGSSPPDCTNCSAGKYNPSVSVWAPLPYSSTLLHICTYISPVTRCLFTLFKSAWYQICTLTRSPRRSFLQRGQGDPSGCNFCPAWRWSDTIGARILDDCHICRCVNSFKTLCKRFIRQSFTTRLSLFSISALTPRDVS